MEQGLLYTFSTIAQALGGAFALLSAFVLYRFQLLKESMYQDAFHLSDAWLGPNARQAYRPLIASGDYEAVADVADSQYAAAQEKTDEVPVTPSWDESRNRLRVSIGKRSVVSSLFKRSAFTTGFVMIGSVAVIPLAHPIHCITWLACSVLVVGIGGFALCLFQYWSLIKAAVYDT